MKRASRTGPSAVMKGGTTWAPVDVRSRVAIATSGFGLCTWPRRGWGLVPPTSGWAWQEAQLLVLNVGPRPFPGSMPPETESTSANRILAALKKFVSFVLSLGNGPPAPAVPGRGPGSDGTGSMFGARAAVPPPSTKHRARTLLAAIADIVTPPSPPRTASAGPHRAARRGRIKKVKDYKARPLAWLARKRPAQRQGQALGRRGRVPLHGDCRADHPTRKRPPGGSRCRRNAGGPCRERSGARIFQSSAGLHALRRAERGGPAVPAGLPRRPECLSRRARRARPRGARLRAGAARRRGPRGKGSREVARFPPVSRRHPPADNPPRRDLGGRAQAAGDRQRALHRRAAAGGGHRHAAHARRLPLHLLRLRRRSGRKRAGRARGRRSLVSPPGPRVPCRLRRAAAVGHGSSPVRLLRDSPHRPRGLPGGGTARGVTGQRGANGSRVARRRLPGGEDDAGARGPGGARFPPRRDGGQTPA